MCVNQVTESQTVGSPITIHMLTYNKKPTQIRFHSINRHLITDTNIFYLCKTTGRIFLSYIADFSYFPTKIIFRKLFDTVRPGQK